MVFIEFLFLWSHRAVRARQDGDASDDESVTAMVSDDQLHAGFEAERRRLQRIAARILGEADAAQDVVQQAWLRLHASDEPIANLAGWLTTVTSRLCLDRLRARTPVPTESIEVEASAIDPADDVVLADTVGIALQVVLDRLTPAERVAFVLHDSFGVDFDSIASMLDTTPVAARKMASRARAKVRPATADDALADWEIVDAFMAAARVCSFAPRTTCSPRYADARARARGSDGFAIAIFSKMYGNCLLRAGARAFTPRWCFPTRVVVSPAGLSGLAGPELGGVAPGELREAGRLDTERLMGAQINVGLRASGTFAEQLVE
jgi:RNA polymerase sigma factor (sigma-70 family)